MKINDIYIDGRPVKKITINGGLYWEKQSTEVSDVSYDWSNPILIDYERYTRNGKPLFTYRCTFQFTLLTEDSEYINSDFQCEHVEDLGVIAPELILTKEGYVFTVEIKTAMLLNDYPIKIIGYKNGQPVESDIYNIIWNNSETDSPTITKL